MNDLITVWEFKSVDGKQTVVSIRPQHADDYKYQHQFQKILYRGIRKDCKANLK
jgi:hypothetical protein